MRILVFGVSEFATELLLELLASPYEVCGLVFNRTNNFDIQDMKALTRPRQIPFWEVENLAEPGFIDQVRQLTPDVILVLTFDLKLPPELYSLAKIAAINLHPSLLPAYRGYHPYFWPLANGETKTGITFHFLAERFDHGPIICQAEVPISPDDTAGTIIHKEKKLAWPLLAPVLAKMAETKEPPAATPQPEGEYPRAPKINPGDLFINWQWPSQKIYDHIRALNPHSPVFTSFRGELIGLYQAEMLTDRSVVNPGTVIKLMPDGPVIKSADGALLLKVVLVGKRYLLSGQDFVAREKIVEGESML